MNSPSTPQTFFSRYFEKNAEQRYAMQLLEFMLWQRGRFIPPMHKAKIQQSFIQQEVEDYKNGIINIPQLQFLVTTRCSLRCINCNAYIPYFGTHGKKHKDLSPQDFKHDLDKLSEAVTHIRRFILIGGEPLLHKELSSLIEIAAQNSMISLIEIITNGTIVPSSIILDTIERYKEKIYFHISNYQANPALIYRLKHEKIFQVLKERDIKYQMSAHQSWSKEIPLQGRSDDEIAQKMFASCWLKRCLQVCDGKLAICPKASSGYELGMVDDSFPGEVISLREIDDVRKQLIAFYQKDFFEACRSCVRIDEEVLVAEQFS